VWLVVIIAIALNPAAGVGPGRGSQLFPVDTPAWREADALAQLANPNATPLEREVARPQLERFGLSGPARVAGVHIPEIWSVFHIRESVAISLDEAEAALADVPYRLATELRLAVEANVNELASNLPSERLAAARRLAHVRQLASSALLHLIRYAGSDDAEFRDAALTAIAEPDTPARSLPIDLLVSLLDDNDPTLRAGAMRTLQRFAPDDPRYTRAMHPPPSRAALLADLRSPRPERRVAAAAYLADANLLPPPVAAALLRSARAGDFAAREGLVIGIESAWRLGGDVEETLKGVTDRDRDPARRTCAKAALAAIASAR